MNKKDNKQKTGRDVARNVSTVYFLGIGGIGMSALARYFNMIGKKVSGYDNTPTALTRQLMDEGINITFEDSIETLDKTADLVVLTPAVPKDSVQLNYYLSSGIPVLKRAKVLGMIANSAFNIAIAGSHGKTSTSSITAHILKTANKDVAAFLGGICINFNSNFIAGKQYVIAEADEFDRSFLNLFPNIALITSVDTDHLDIYGNLEAIQQSFSAFCSQIRDGGCCIYNKQIDAKILNPEINNLSYSLHDHTADFYTENLIINSGSYVFDVVHPQGKIEKMVFNYGGKHNVENALGAIAIALQVGVGEADIKQAIATFKGVKRRFETHIKNKNFVYIDDYAHHPREIDAALSAAKELYPNRKITAIFQPHLFSRTKDLCDEFAHSLSQIDELILLEIYPAREKPIEGVSSQIILDKVTIADKTIIRKENLLDYLTPKRAELEVVITIGAGDIDTVVAGISELLKDEN
jgi:UDP-N-acetylmuramate--alanine ligase